MNAKQQPAKAILTVRDDQAEAEIALRRYVSKADGAKIVKTRANGAIYEVVCPAPALARMKAALAAHFVISGAHRYEQL